MCIKRRAQKGNSPGAEALASPCSHSWSPRSRAAPSCAPQERRGVWGAAAGLRRLTPFGLRLPLFGASARPPAWARTSPRAASGSRWQHRSVGPTWPGRGLRSGSSRDRARVLDDPAQQPTGRLARVAGCPGHFGELFPSW